MHAWGSGKLERLGESTLRKLRLTASVPRSTANRTFAMGRRSLKECISDCSDLTSASTEIADSIRETDIHVLAVDDSNLDRKLIEVLLKTSKFTVTSVNSAVKALDVLGLKGTTSSGRLDVDLIITDYCMPEMTGYELLQRIKDSDLKEVPVVIVSSENVPTRINRCLAEGAEEFLIKPVKLADVKRLRSHMRQSMSMSASSSESSGSSFSTKRKVTASSSVQIDDSSRRGRSMGLPERKDRRLLANPLLRFVERCVEPACSQLCRCTQ